MRALRLTDDQMVSIMDAASRFAPRVRSRLLWEVAARLPLAPTDDELQAAVRAALEAFTHSREARAS